MIVAQEREDVMNFIYTNQIVQTYYDIRFLQKPEVTLNDYFFISNGEQPTIPARLITHKDENGYSATNYLIFFQSFEVNPELNRNHLTTFAQAIKMNLIIPEVRGMGLNRTKEIGFDYLFSDTKRLMDFLVDEAKIEPKNLFLYGFTANCAVSTYAATLYPVGGLVLDKPAPYVNIDSSVCCGPYFCSKLQNERLLDCEKFIKDVTCPLRILGNEEEFFFRIEFNRMVLDAAKVEDKQFIQVEGNTESGVLNQYFETYIEDLVGAIKALGEGSAFSEKEITWDRAFKELTEEVKINIERTTDFNLYLINTE